MAIVSNDLKLDSHKIHGVDEYIEGGILYDKDYIGMSSNAAVRFDVGVLKPNEKREFSIMIFVSDNENAGVISDIESKIKELKKIEVKKELQNTKQYWRKYVKSHIRYEFNNGTQYREKINDIYVRTILLYPLLTNEQTGGIAAAMEIDEEFSRCRKVCILLAKRCDIYYKGSRFIKNGKNN